MTNDLTAKLMDIPICLWAFNVRATANVSAVSSVNDFRSPAKRNWQIVNFSIFVW